MKMLFNPATMLMAAVLLAAADTRAATFTNIYIFSADNLASGTNPQATNSDGTHPNGLALSGNVMYGTANEGGTNGCGTVFRVNTDGSNFTILTNFNQGPYDSASGNYPANIGDQPNPGLVLVSNTLYGTTFIGGIDSVGSVFKINTDGTGLATIQSFTIVNGQQPTVGMTLYNNVLYGTTTLGGSSNYGTIFAVDPSDSSFSTVYSFTNLVMPYGGVVVSGNAFYGFGYDGGSSNLGMVYRVAGGGYADLLDFTGPNGAKSWATPSLVGNTLYGVTYQGGSNGSGNVFRINTDGSAYTNLYSFSPADGGNTDGAQPYDFAGLVVSGNKIYGTTSSSGSGGQGTVFQMNTDGSAFTVLQSFSYPIGSQPGALLLSGGTIYGAATYGVQGISLGDGAIFALTLEPTLTISPSDNNVILTWDDPSYSLYGAPTLTSVFTNITGATSPYTYPITGAQQFFQLE
jgi:uncharacterized repeat protein (TIGR03803 family)